MENGSVHRYRDVSFLRSGDDRLRGDSSFFVVRFVALVTTFPFFIVFFRSFSGMVGP